MPVISLIDMLNFMAMPYNAQFLLKYVWTSMDLGDISLLAIDHT